MKKFYNHKALPVFLLIATLGLLGFGCAGGDSSAQAEITKPIKLKWWRVEDTLNDFNPIIQDYKVMHPNVSVAYTKFRPENLEGALKDALAAGNGPDIISVPNTSMRAWQKYLTPLPSELNISFIEMSGWIKKEPTAITKKVATLTMLKLKSTFLEVAANDAVIDGKIYGLPVSMDTLLLYYNRDLLNAASLSAAPTTWNDFKTDVQKITIPDKQGYFLKNGAALGEADNIPHAADILSNIMLQTGTRMLNTTNSRATFDQEVIAKDGKQYTPGINAANFYTDFANPGKEIYTWSKEELNAWQAFAAGKVAFTFGYWRDFNTIKALAPKINLGVGNFPQILPTEPIYYANYYLEAVTKQSKNSQEAWDFLQFATKPEETAKYLQATKKPTAHRVFVDKQLEDFDLNTPAKQLLSAKSWYHGYKYSAAEEALRGLIRQINTLVDVQEAINFASRQVTLTLNPPAY